MVAIVTDPNTSEKKNKSKKKHKHHSSSSSLVVEPIGKGMDHVLVDENNSKKKKKKRKEDKYVQPHNEDNKKKKKKKKKVKLVEDNHTDDNSIATQLETIGLDKGKGNDEDVVSVESQTTKSKKKKHTADLVENASTEKNKSKKKLKDDGVEQADKGKKRKAENNDTVETKKSKKKHKGQPSLLVVSDSKGEKKMSKVANKKKVRFSDKNDVFILPSNSDQEDSAVPDKRATKVGDNLVRGKRFTKEEDEILKLAVLHYVDKLNLGDQGLDMVLNCSKHKALKGCWREIASQIPYRPYTACYSRAQVIFRRSLSRKWTQEEYDFLLKQQAEHGNNWKGIAEDMGKHRWHVKDTWRRIHMRTKKGHWSQQEYQKLFDLVNKDLQTKALEERHSKHGMLRDNIPWTAISEEVTTRDNASCCTKWYKQLQSRMVTEGVWADVDDYVLISALYSLDANCIEDVDWDDILENRSGDLCRKRWNQMVLHIGHHGNKSFSEQVEILAQRYCPHLLEAREAWDNKPLINP